MKISSKSPRKQRNFIRNLSLHLRKNLCICHLSKELKKELKKRSLSVRKGDKVKIMRGKQKKKEGKILGVNYAKGWIFVEKIVRKKSDGKEVQVPIRASNALLTELDRSDDRRLGEKTKEAEKAKPKTAEKAKQQKNDIWAEEKTKATVAEKKVK